MFVCGAVRQALEKKPEARFATAEDMASALNGSLTVGQSRGQPPVQVPSSGIPTYQDIPPSDEYLNINSLLRDSKRIGWTDAKTGCKLLQHFGHLVNVAERHQGRDGKGICAICNAILSDVEDIGITKGYIVHRTCMTKRHRAFSRTERIINRTLMAYKERANLI